ncbi:MAG: sulfurtransferase TusA family protein [Chlorobiaceae bacterium]|nr:sulfurtransferase TusA family protein [Chlorobiaceae bacterium]
MQEQDHSRIENIDLRGVSCPVNATMAKKAISQLHEGETVRIIFDSGESLIRAVRSINDAGYRIVKSEQLDNAVAVIVGKGKPAERP